MADEAYSPRQYPNARTASDSQWLRKWDLTLYRAGSSGGLTITTQTEGHDFRMVFRTRLAETAQTNNTAEIRIYNLSRDTARDVIHEFDRVVLQAGYMTGHYGIIFTGTIKFYKIGRESAVDGYLDLYCASADLLNDTFLLKSNENPTNPEKEISDEIQARALDKVEGLQRGEIETPNQGILLPRGHVLMSTWKQEAREYERSTRTSWFVQNDKLNLLPKTAYARGDIVVINSGTGLVGAPEQTTAGVNLTCLLNPNLYVKGRVQLDQREFNQYQVPISGNTLNGQPNADWRSIAGMGQFMAPLTADGVYSIVCVDHQGDTRGQPWYSHLICTHQHPDAPWDTSVTAGDWRPT